MPPPPPPLLLLLLSSLLLLGSAAGGDAAGKAFDEPASQRLLVAAKAGDLEGAARALTDGADPDAMDSREFTALMLAGQHGHTKVLKTLIAFGAALATWWKRTSSTS